MSEKRERVLVPAGKVQAPPAGALGIRAYARRRTEAGKPISHTAIGNAIKTGRIVGALWRDDRGRAFIIPELADELLDQNTDPSAQRDTKAGGRPPEERSDGLFAEGGPEAENVQTHGNASKEERDKRDGANASYVMSRAAREAIDARLAGLKLKREMGELVRSDLVRERCESVATTLRDAFRTLPKRICGELLNQTDPERIQAILREEIDHTLRALSELGRPLA